jgi:hypothetical protein
MWGDRHRDHQRRGEASPKRRGGTLKRLLGWIGATLGGSIGWWSGARIGIMTGVIASAIATGVGLYLGWWTADRLLD